VLFDKICRKNGIKHRLTQPASPNQNGKVERFHGTFRPDFLDRADPFTSVEDAQTAVDAWVVEYNADRPHQALDAHLPVTPAERFEPVPVDKRDLIELWLPPPLEAAAPPAPTTFTAGDEPAPVVPSPAVLVDPEPVQVLPAPVAWAGGGIEFDRVVPPSGMITVAGKAFWLGGYRSGMTVRVWADVDVIHLLVAGARVKSVRSHLTINDLAKLAATGAVTAGPPPLPPPDDGDAIEVDRVVSRAGTLSLGQHVVLAAEILGGRQVGVRIEPDVLMFFDLQTRELLRTRPNPLTESEMRRIRGARKAGPPPRPSIEPIRVQRRASNTGVVMVAGQKVALGRVHKHQTVTVVVSETTLAFELDDGDTRVVRRTTTQPVRSIKGHRPRTASVS
jgi:hypothetical protein